ncbi:MAG: Wzt carbohydrate-binding domain-containing protein, partial [Herminiimonas sp.]|nr:Wzt carbohydrate-binding domain-containing protein [Herminiimonas sp.]
LSGGRVVKEGAPEEVMDYYNAMLAEREHPGSSATAAGGPPAKQAGQRATNRVAEPVGDTVVPQEEIVADGTSVRQIRRDDGRVQTISGTGEASVIDVRLMGVQGQAQEVFDVGVAVSLVVRIACHAPIPRLVLGYMIKDRLGQAMYGTNTDIKRQVQNDVQPGETIEYRFDFRLDLGPGTYSVATALVSTDTHLVNNYEWRDLALVFTVANMTRDHFVGCAWCDPVIHTSRPRVADAATT